MRTYTASWPGAPGVFGAHCAVAGPGIELIASAVEVVDAAFDVRHLFDERLDVLAVAQVVTARGPAEIPRRGSSRARAGGSWGPVRINRLTGRSVSAPRVDGGGGSSTAPAWARVLVVRLVDGDVDLEDGVLDVLDVGVVGQEALIVQVDVPAVALVLEDGVLEEVHLAHDLIDLHLHLVQGPLGYLDGRLGTCTGSGSRRYSHGG